MNIDDFSKLSRADKIDYLKKAYRDDEVYAGIKNRFLDEFGTYLKDIDVTVDNYGIGDVPSVIVFFKEKIIKKSLPKTFLDLPVVRK